MKHLTIVWGTPANPLDVDADSMAAFFRIMNENPRSPGDSLTLIIESAGGHVYQGLSVHGYLLMMKDHGVTVRTHVNSEIASMASFIHLAGEVRSMSPNARIGLHCVSHDSGAWSPASCVFRYTYGYLIGMPETISSSVFSTPAVTWFNHTISEAFRLTNHPVVSMPIPSDAIYVTVAPPPPPVVITPPPVMMPPKIIAPLFPPLSNGGT